MSTITIVTPEGGVYRVDFLPHDTLSSLREKVALLHSVSLQQRDFFCNGKLVPEQTKLQSIGITPAHALTTGPNKSLQISITSSAPQSFPIPTSTTPRQPYSPNLQIHTGTSPSPRTSPGNSPSFQSSLQASQQQTRLRSGSVGTMLGAPPPHPSAPHSAQDSHTRRRSSLSSPSIDPFAHLPHTGPSPFDIVEQTLRKAEAAHPISPALYDRADRESAPSTPTPANGVMAAGSAGPASPLPRSDSFSGARSQPTSPLIRTPSSPLPVSSSPSTSTFQPVLSYRSKLTALSIAIAELVDERRLLESKSIEEKQRIEEEITTKKKHVEETIWEGEKRVALVAAEVEAERQRVAKVEAERDKLRQVYDGKVRELEEAKEEKKRDEQRCNGLLDQLRSQIAEYMHLRENLKQDSKKDVQILIRGAVDLLVRAGIDLDEVRKEVESRKA